MHIAILSFQLKGITKDQFYAVCDDLAPKLAAIPGLVSKVWLADPSSNTYGGVYTFRDRAAFTEFMASDLARSIAQNPTIEKPGGARLLGPRRSDARDPRAGGGVISGTLGPRARARDPAPARAASRRVILPRRADADERGACTAFSGGAAAPLHARVPQP